MAWFCAVRGYSVHRTFYENYLLSLRRLQNYKSSFPLHTEVLSQLSELFYFKELIHVLKKKKKSMIPKLFLNCAVCFLTTHENFSSYTSTDDKRSSVPMVSQWDIYSEIRNTGIDASCKFCLSLTWIAKLNWRSCNMRLWPPLYYIKSDTVSPETATLEPISWCGSRQSQPRESLSVLETLQARLSTHSSVH